MAAITPIKYAETSTGGVRNPMRDFVSNLPNIYNQYLTILDRNRQRELQEAQFDESKRQFDEAQALAKEQFEAQNLQNLNANTLGQLGLLASIQANENTRQYQQDTLKLKKDELDRRINESGGSGGYKRDSGLDTHIQKEIDYYYSLAKDIDSLSSYIARLRNTSNDSEFYEWFAKMPEEEQNNFLRYSAFSGKKIGEKIDYAKLADSLSMQLDEKHSQAQSVYKNMANYIDNTNKALGWPAYNKPVNLFPERDPVAIRAEYEKNLLEQEKINAANEAERKKRMAAIMAEQERLKKLREQIEEAARGSNNNNLSGSSTGQFGAPVKAENRVETDATKIADYLQGLQNTVYDARTLRNRGTNPISLGIGNPGDPYFNGGNNVYEQYLKALNAGKIR